MSDFRVLSIQSHVVHGYVGNKSATFPLQVHGFEVDAINSVQFSNHTGYGHWKGQVLNSNELTDLYEGLKLNQINNYTHLLTGYVGSESFLEEVVNVLSDLKKVNPNLVFVCDPVMGDNGKFYVPESLLPVYRDKLLPLAYIITPNQFEAELLSGMKINSEQNAFEAMDILHNKGTKCVVITSSELGKDNTLVALGSFCNFGLSGNNHKLCIRMEIPKLPAVFTGTGDLFASLLLVWMQKHPNDLKLACEKTMSAVQAVLKRTLQEAQELAGPDNKPNSAQIELRLIKSMNDLLNPQVDYKATIVKF
ncbi:Pyridoxal kinase [Paramuricea clavata]|uniref:Pyridoxal kinase n=1 Tax=Paramuricea clavata TaxID=317549 RepID=A0A7D9HQE5_PARCT|nr:Pyridoxal kinase [Paramuricea clavata]CAB3988200.1 Pyridoxal kinase [Paramuricea clavata]CAB3988205.1 Pyridoxal kinase [Paramuricea clavata]